MKCMYAQTRPRFILSSEGVFGGMEFEPIFTPREKSPLPENVPRGGSNPRHCGQRAQALPTELFRPPKAILKAGTGARIACWSCVGLFVMLDAASRVQSFSEENSSCRGDFSFGVNMGSDSIPHKTLSDESID